MSTPEATTAGDKPATIRHPSVLSHVKRTTDPNRFRIVSPAQFQNRGSFIMSAVSKANSDPGHGVGQRASYRSKGTTSPKYNTHNRKNVASQLIRTHRTSPRKRLLSNSSSPSSSYTTSSDTISSSFTSETLKGDSEHTPTFYTLPVIRNSTKSSTPERGKSSPAVQLIEPIRFSSVPRMKKPGPPRAPQRTSSQRALNERYAVRLANGTRFTMAPVANQTIGEALKPHIIDVQRPVECFEQGTDRSIPWNTLTKDLLQITVEIREVPGLSQVASLGGKKLEKRNSLTGEAIVALKQWFSYIASIHRDTLQLADLLELKCYTENAPTTDPTVQRLLGAENSMDKDLIRQSLENFSQDGDINSVENLHLLCDQLLSVKANWTELVQTKQEFTIREQKKQAAIWEVFVTEVNYIQYLRNLLNVYLDNFNRNRDKVFQNMDSSQMFSNLPQVYQANLRLWFLYLHKAYTRLVENGDLLRVEMLESGFMQIPDLFWPYNNYCLDLQRCQKYIKMASSSNPAFRAFLEWADSKCRTHREPLWDQLVRPMKRVTQYGIMLDSIRKYCDDEEEIACVQRMLNHISTFVRTIDNNINQWEPRERMHVLVDMLMFPDYNENPGDGYQYFYDNHRRISLLQDIELPAPVVLTSSELRSILDSLVLEKSHTTVLGSMIFEEPDASRAISALPTSKMGRSHPDLRILDPHGTQRASGIDPTVPKRPSLSMSRSNSSKDLRRITFAPESVRVVLSKWVPPASFDSRKLAPSILDGILDSDNPVGLRRSVPRTLIHKGSLRYRDRQRKWMDGTCFLLTDQFLITKGVKRDGQDRYQVCRTPIRLDKLLIKKLNEAGYFACAGLDDFNMIISLYTFYTNNVAADEWCLQMKKAKENYLRMMQPEILIATNYLSSGKQTPGESSNAGSTSPNAKSPNRKETLLNLARKSLVSEMNSPVIKNPVIKPTSESVIIPDQGLLVTDTRARSPNVYGRQLIISPQPPPNRTQWRSKYSPLKLRSPVSATYSASNESMDVQKYSANPIFTFDTILTNGTTKNLSQSEVDMETSLPSIGVSSISNIEELGPSRIISVDANHGNGLPRSSTETPIEGEHDRVSMPNTTTVFSRPHSTHGSTSTFLVRQAPVIMTTHSISSNDRPTLNRSVRVLHVNGGGRAIK